MGTAFRESATEALAHLVQSTLDAREHTVPPAAVPVLREFLLRHVLPLLHRERRAAETPYRIALVGLTNVGKSTLLQCLLGERVAPAANRPMTAAPVWYRHAPQWSVELEAGLRTRRIDAASPEEVYGILERSTAEGGAGERVSWAVVGGPMALLSEGLELADTPGFGSAHADGDDAHDAALERLLESGVHEACFVVSAGGDRWAIGTAEAAAYRSLVEAGCCRTVLVNKWTGSFEDEEEYRRRYEALLPGAEFHFTNARRALKGDDDAAGRVRMILASRSSASRRFAQVAGDACVLWHDIETALSRRQLAVRWPPMLLDRLLQRIHYLSPERNPE